MDRAIAVSAPSPAPATTFRPGANERIASATGPASRRGAYTPFSRRSDRPWPGRSMASAGRSRASSSRSHCRALRPASCSSTRPDDGTPQVKPLT
ncbi:hypothetical protein [Acrocarpospora sp. B8E8]|uniref:hypothetical protein n=1 Tax=Acrocarpospora sp. B8E8 TaxID=3153572 RepID=UPI00325F41E5